MADFSFKPLLPSRLTALSALALLGGMLATAPEARAAYVVSNDESFSYTGTVTAPDSTVYAIPSYVSTPGSTIYNGRDMAVYATSGAPTSITGAGYENYTQFGTNWYSSTDATHGPVSGWGSPNNTNTGFFQLVNSANSNLTSIGGRWTDATHTTFTMSITGTAMSSSELYNRLWAAPQVGGPSGDTAGTFKSYTLTLTATFAPGAVTEEFPGWYSTVVGPISVTGSITGSFDNTSTTNPGNNGIYQFDLSFQDINWAANNNIPDSYGSYFGSSEVPEPASMALLGAGLFSLALVRRRKRA